MHLVSVAEMLLKNRGVTFVVPVGKPSARGDTVADTHNGRIGSQK